MLEVEDGTGKANAESLTDVAFADDYHAKRGNTAWTDIQAEETKEQLLRKATDYFVGTYDLALASEREFEGQALSFPRLAWPGMTPVTIQQAIAELALIAKTTPLTPVITRGKKAVKVGPISVQYDGNSPMSRKFISASLRVAPFLNSYSSNNVNVKLIRV